MDEEATEHENIEVINSKNGSNGTDFYLNPLLCQPIDTIDLLYEEVENIVITQEGHEWLSKRVKINQKDWIVFSTSVTNKDLISSITINTNEIKIHDHYRIGTKVSEIIAMGDAFTYNEGEGGEYFYLINSRDYHLGFRVEPKFSSTFYKKANSGEIEEATEHLDPNAGIVELTIQIICHK